MAASITTFPDSRSMSLEPIWLTLETDLWAEDTAYFELLATGFNVEDETLELTWDGTTLTFTLKDSPDYSGLQLPTYLSGTTAEYHELLATYLQMNEILTDDFICEYNSGTNRVIITWRYNSAVTLSKASTISNMGVTDNDSLGSITAENLRALVQVFEYTGDIANDPKLATLHAPYNADTGQATFDLRPAFAALKPHLPTPASITAFAYAEATSAFMQYYWRYADKYGVPAVAEALLAMLEGSWYCIYGGVAGDALAGSVSANSWPDEDLRHNYISRNNAGVANGLSFWKPVGQSQPDWVYVWNNSAGNRTVKIHAYYQDGTDAEVLVEGPYALDEKTLYWFSAGPGNLPLDIDADPDNPIVRYTWALHTTGPLKITTVQYEILPDCQDWGFYLLFDNGLGGCETVWLKGKATEGYDAAADTVQRIRTEGWTPDLGEFDKLGATGQTTWEVSTGLHEDESYLINLRQLPLSSAAWLVDVENERFLKVLVDAKRIDIVQQDDQDLYSLTFTIRAAWQDLASNL